MRVALFVNHHLTSSIELAAAALRTAGTRENLDVVAIVDTSRDRPGRARIPRELALRTGRRLSHPRTAAPFAQVPLLTTPSSLARRHRVPLLAPRERTVNDPDFVAKLRDELEIDAALVLMVDQLFKPPLLSACGYAVNYHNAALPAYRGMGGPEWSIYLGETTAGFTFHRMVEGLDAGPILVEGAVEVPAGASADAVERRKTEAAGAALGDVLDAIARREEGREQTGEAGHFSAAELGSMRDVGDGSELTAAELDRRLRAFGVLQLTHEGHTWHVTALRPARRGPAITTADGQRLEPHRVMHLSPALFRVYASAGLVQGA